jgi:hypothetical protein
MQVADLQRSVECDQKMFDFSVVGRDQRLPIISPGVDPFSLNRQSPAGIVDHFAIGPRFSRESAARFLKRSGNPEDASYAGRHIKDPDGINVQIFSHR